MNCSKHLTLKLIEMLQHFGSETQTKKQQIFSKIVIFLKSSGYFLKLLTFESKVGLKFFPVGCFHMVKSFLKDTESKY